MLYDKALERYFSYQITSIKPISYKTIQTRFKLYITPYFTSKVLPCKIDDLIDFKTYLSKLDISVNYKRNLFTNLACFLNFVETIYDIPNNLKKLKNFKKEPKKNRNILTYNEYLSLREHFNDYEKCFFDVLFFGGLRRGEALALNKNSIISNTCIYITQTYTRNTLTTPKTTTSIRRVSLPEEIIKTLTYYADKYPTRIFQDLSYSTIKRHFDIALTNIKHSPMRIHDLRHSHITNLLIQGFTPQSIAKRVGHTNIETLLNVYAETINEDELNINKHLENIIKKPLI